jgi:hypothetical protein
MVNCISIADIDTVRVCSRVLGADYFGSALCPYFIDVKTMDFGTILGTANSNGLPNTGCGSNYCRDFTL